MDAPSHDHSGWSAIGPHRYFLDQDLFRWSPSGEVHSDHARAVCELFDRQAAKYGYVLWLVNAKNSVPIGFETRRIYATHMRETHIRMAIASFGATLGARTTATLTAHAARLMTKSEIPLEDFDREDQARAFLIAQRERFKASG